MKVKICGVTTPEDAALAVELGADLLGLNFWAGSPRAVSLARARAVAGAVGGRALLVGVFVDAGRAVIERAVAEVGLDRVQLHGDEPPEQAAPFAAMAIKAFRLAAAPEPAAVEPFGGCWGFLFDAARPGAYGGTGAAWPWEHAAALPSDRPVLLAGGIAPGRVRELLARARRGGATEQWRPWGIDVCSGVESRPGIKDPARLRALFEEVRDAQAPTLA